jgi:uncharacterized membrane protein
MATSGAHDTGSSGREAAERARSVAHRPGNALAGPYGHPVHPMIVPVAIGAWVAAVAFDVASLTLEGQAYGRPAKWLVAIGVVAAIVAAVFGLIDYRRIAKGTRAHRLATTHLIVNDVALGLFIVSFLLRHTDDRDLLDGTPVLAFVLALVALVLLGVGGWLGGELVYRYGLRVTDEVDQLEGYRAEAPSSTSSAQEPASGPGADTSD